MPPNSGKRLSIVVPVFNESATIAEVFRRVKAAKLPAGWSKEIVIVDDGSDDGTQEILRSFSDCKAIFCRENRGKGAALKEGFKAATGDYILIQDADMEYDPDDYQALIKPIIDGRAQAVFGSRTLSKNNVPFSRIFFYGGLLISKIFNLAFKTRISDVATCYKVFPRAYVEDLARQPSQDFVFDVIELSHILARKTDILEVPISYKSRGTAEGKKMNWLQGWRCFRKIVALFIHEKVGYFDEGWMGPFLVFSLFFGVFFLVYFSVLTLSSGDDHFFLFRFAQEMLHNGFFHSFQDFKSIYFSWMAHGNFYFVYYNFIFFLFIIPFAFITPLYLGIKLYAVFMAALAFTFLYWCLKRFAVKNPFIWTLVILAISNTSSIWRFFLSRSYAMAPALLLLLVYFLFRKNRKGAFAVSFIYLFWNSLTFFMPLLVAVVYYVVERFYKDKGDWKSLLAIVGGIAVAIGATYAVSSGFFFYIWDIVIKIYWETILGKAVHIAEGGELYPIDFFNFIQGNALIFATFVTAATVDIFSYVTYRFKRATESEYFLGMPRERRYLQTAVFILTACFFLGTVAASSRFGDYFTFFAALYIALAFDCARRLLKVSGGSMIRQSLATALAIVLIYLFASNMLFLEARLSVGQSAYELYQTGRWLSENSKPGDIVFESNWSWFTQLYYWSPGDYYSSGLEPRFMYNYSPELYWKSVHIVNDGYVCGEPACPGLAERQQAAVRQGTSTKEWAKTEGDKIADSLRDDFGAKYVVTSSRNQQFFNYILSNNKNFKLEQYDQQFGYLIFSVIYR